MLATAFETDLIRNTWNLQRDYNWEIFLPDMGNLAGYQVAMYCQDVKFGDYSISEIEAMRYGAFQAKFPGLMSVEDVTFTFLKPVPDIVSSYFYYWRSLIINSSGYYGLKSQYAMNLRIILFDTTGAVSNTIQLIGVWPKTVPSYGLSYGSEKMTEFTITCSVDRVSYGDYVPPVFAQDLETPVVRQEYEVAIGNSTQNEREATNAAAFSYSTARQFFPAATTNVGVSSPGLNFGGLISVASSIFRPNPLPGISTPVPVPENTPTLTIDVQPTSELIDRYGGGENNIQAVVDQGFTPQLNFATPSMLG